VICRPHRGTWRLDEEEGKFEQHSSSTASPWQVYSTTSPISHLDRNSRTNLQVLSSNFQILVLFDSKQQCSKYEGEQAKGAA
jgi:hypothetical protein